jgi:hypothetical protein
MLRPFAHAVQSVAKCRLVKPQFFAEKVICAQLAAGTHSTDSDTFKYSDFVITLDGTNTNKSGNEAKATLNFRNWVGLTNVFAVCALTAGYRKAFCNAWVSLPLSYCTMKSTTTTGCTRITVSLFTSTRSGTSPGP